MGLVTLFVGMIDNVYNHREESKFRNGDVNIVNEFMGFESGLATSVAAAAAAVQPLRVWWRHPHISIKKMQRWISKRF